MAKRTPSRFSDTLLDELLSGQDPSTVLSSAGVLGDLKKALAQRMLNAELEAHLETDVERESGNHRNGFSRKTVHTESGDLEALFNTDSE